MYTRALILAMALEGLAGLATAASREVQYSPPPTWVTPPPRPTEAVAHDGAAVRVIYQDMQTRLGESADEIYISYRLKLLKPEALSLGNVRGIWNPSTDDFIVHELQLIRGGQVIDVLANSRFDIIQRENHLEYSVFDGQLTATLQVPGLQVGDEIAFSATTRRHDATLGNRSSGMVQLPWTGTVGTFRARVVWPAAKMVRWHASPDLGPIDPRVDGGLRELKIEIKDPKSVLPTEGAPARFNVRRRIEYSGFASWSDLSNAVWPVLDQATRVSPGSELRAEIDRIALSTPDPVKRIEAALALVQDRIRYVFVGLNGGNIRPAAAEDTWSRRFGDCKAKSALLVAMLRELGVASEAVLVNTSGGDGTDELLPTPAAFDHMVVRATVSGASYWLDGTRLGDRHLDLLPAPAFRWALPLRAGAVALEPVPVQPPKSPQLISVLDIDAGAGFDAPAQVSARNILRGADVFPLRRQLSALQPEDVTRFLKFWWRRQLPNWVEVIEKVDWRYEESRDALQLSMSGQGKPDWTGDDEEGRTLGIPGAGFNPPEELRRPAEQDQTAPWVTDFPTYKCWVTTIKLPAADAKWHWDYSADPVDERLGGVAYWREAYLKGGVMRTIMSRRVELPEITRAMAEDLNTRLTGFDNHVSQVFQRLNADAVAPASQPARLGDWAGATAADWMDAATPCAASMPSAQASGQSQAKSAATSSKRGPGKATADLATAPSASAGQAPAREVETPSQNPRTADASRNAVARCVGAALSADDKTLVARWVWANDPLTRAAEGVRGPSKAPAEALEVQVGALVQRLMTRDCLDVLKQADQDTDSAALPWVVHALRVSAFRELIENKSLQQEQLSGVARHLSWTAVESALGLPKAWYFEVMSAGTVLALKEPVAPMEKAHARHPCAGPECRPEHAKASGSQEGRLVCTRMVKPVMPSVFWSGQMALTALVQVRDGRVRRVDVTPIRSQTSPSFGVAPGGRMPESLVAQYVHLAQRKLARSVAEAAAQYECQGEHIFEQSFLFNIE